MERSEEIKLLMMDGCTESEAKNHLENGAVVFDDFEENFDSYMKEWDCNEEEKEACRKMIDSKNPATDWGVVEQDGNTYYIMYIL